MYPQYCWPELALLFGPVAPCVALIGEGTPEEHGELPRERLVHHFSGHSFDFHE